MKYLVLSLGAVLLLFQTSCSTQRAIGNYCGDGEIVALPDGGIVQGGGGYEVRFERVRLDQPAHLTYQFTGLPKIAWQVQVYFALEGPQELERRNDGSHPKPPFIDDLSGTLALVLKDADGKVILESRHKLSEFIWTGVRKAQWLYDDKNVGFTANPTKKYILEMSIRARCGVEGL